MLAYELHSLKKKKSCLFIFGRAVSLLLHGLLIAMASLVAEQGSRARGSVAEVPRL